jgi:hypothetical protein
MICIQVVRSFTPQFAKDSQLSYLTWPSAGAWTTLCVLVRREPHNHRKRPQFL